MVTIVVTEFNYKVISDLQSQLESAIALEATKMAVRCNMHMDDRVFEVADFKSEVKFDP